MPDETPPKTTTHPPAATTAATGTASPASGATRASATAPQVPPAVPPASAPRDERKLGELVFDVTEGVSGLVREEIQLAKTEVAEKAGKIAKGAAVGVAAGIFAFLALILVMEGIAWLLNEEVFDGKTWPGFFIEAAIFLLIAALAAFIAFKAVKAGSPPVPEQAIEEAKLTKETLKGDAR